MSTTLKNDHFTYGWYFKFFSKECYGFPNDREIINLKSVILSNIANKNLITSIPWELSILD